MTRVSLHGFWQQSTDRLADHICCHPNTKKQHLCTHKHTHAIGRAHTTTSTERRENGVGEVKGLGGWQWEKKMEKEAEGE